MEVLNTEIIMNSNRINHVCKTKLNKIISFNTYVYIHADTTISIASVSLLILIRRCQMLLNMNGYMDIC